MRMMQMKRARALLLTSLIDEGQSTRLLQQIKRECVGIKVVLVASLAQEGFADSSATKAPILTRRQTEVLREMADGNGMKKIARKLGISPKTVETHREAVMKRLGIRHIPGLVRYALRTGVVPASWLMVRN